MDYKDIEIICKKLFGNNPTVMAAAFVGGVGMVNVVDSLIAAQLGITWTIIPDWVRPIFTLIRNGWRPLIDFVLRYLPFKVSDPAKDYMLMGSIVVGMRIRSSMVIWRAVNDQSLAFYKQKTVLTNHPVILRRGERLKFYGFFLPIRLSYAFVAWPIKIFGAWWRYLNGEWRKGYSNKTAEKVRQEQYFTFFGTVFWAVFLLFVFLVFR